MHRLALALRSIARLARQQQRLRASLYWVIFSFILSLGVRAAMPLIKATNLAPNQQIICLGSGGMKVVSVGADGFIDTSPGISKTSDGWECPLCGTLQPALSLGPAVLALPSPLSAKPIPEGLAALGHLKPLIARARAPPSIS